MPDIQKCPKLILPCICLIVRIPIKRFVHILRLQNSKGGSDKMESFCESLRIIEYFGNLWEICLYELPTVGNRVDEIPGSVSSKFCFRTFYPIDNTLTKKKPQHETPCYLPDFRYLPSKSKLWRNGYLFLVVKGSTLEANISARVQILFIMYILIRKVF